MSTWHPFPNDEMRRLIDAEDDFIFTSVLNVGNEDWGAVAVSSGTEQYQKRTSSSPTPRSTKLKLLILQIGIERRNFTFDRVC